MRSLAVITSIVLLMTLTTNASDVCPETDRGWAFKNSKTGISSCAAKYLVKKPQKVLIAVLDTGVDYNHPMISPLLRINRQDIARQPRRLFPEVDPKDDHGHGTHIAGIIASVGDQVFGKNTPIEIIPIKMDQAGKDWSPQQNAAAIRYVVDKGVKIINISSGGKEPYPVELAAIKYAEAAGVLVVCAAGNESENADKNPFYPANYNLSNMISVTSLDPSGNLLPSSNWGNSVDVAAPGKLILSSYKNKEYSLMTGTSQATAFVSGIAAVLLSQNPRLKAKDIKEIIESSTKKNLNLVGKIKTGGEVDIDRALIRMQSYRRSIASEK